ncbi:hypothetical protein SAMN05660297_03224 [Natronincola peptidivorans]|uniref:Uncharacterized protein n=1 Tax=Natronincola peptidivorans TaxID=426128 RepID=A0A1I0GIB5_9FIRM|nr:hypothetical protein [Natronincola peptidivorans]SET70644.1 hypothetical protein SAMN05660297_03224 [Natronincola peptidivorans]
MRKRIKMLTWLLVISLGLNVYSILKMERAYNNMTNQLHGSINNTMHNLMHDISGLYRKIDEITQENRWVVSEEFIPNMEASTSEELHLNVEWSLNEVEKGAKIALLYRAKGEAEGWNQVIVNHTGGNNFSAPLILSPEKDYEYQLVSEGNIIKTNEITEIPPQHYKPSPLHYSGAGASSTNGKLLDFRISFAQREPVLFDFYKVKNVTAIIHYGNEQKVFPLKLRHIGRTEWELEMGPDDLEKSITAVMLEVEYANGAVEETDFTTEVLDVMRDMVR